jgi:hypothetical protein
MSHDAVSVDTYCRRLEETLGGDAVQSVTCFGEAGCFHLQDGRIRRNTEDKYTMSARNAEFCMVRNDKYIDKVRADC